MSQHGILKATQNPERPFQGDLNCFVYNGEFYFEKVENRPSSKSPNYNMIDKASKQQVGSVWERTTNENNEVFFGITLDSMEMEAKGLQPVNLSAFKNKEGSYNINWKRQRQVSTD